MENKQKKIIYVITKSNWGGAQRYVFDLAVNFNNKFDVSVLFGGNGELKKRLEQANIKTFSLDKLQRDIKFTDDIKNFFELIKIFKKEKPDIVHLNSAKVGFSGSLAARLTNVPKIIFTSHGWAFNEDRNFASKKIIFLLQWLTVLLCHKTICVSNSVASQMNKTFFTKKKITTIYNGTSPINFFENKEAKKFLSEKNLELKNKTAQKNLFWLGTISELHSNKGTLYTIKAISLIKEKFKKLPFVFIIIGEGEKRKELEKLILTENLSETVFLLGHIKDGSKYLKAFDIFTLTSTTEALGYVILEAGIARLPVIASRVGGIPEIISHLENGYLAETKNIEEIAKGIEYLLINEGQRKIFGDNLFKTVKEKFETKKMIEETEKIYTNIKLCIM